MKLNSSPPSGSSFWVAAAEFFSVSIKCCCLPSAIHRLLLAPPARGARREPGQDRSGCPATCWSPAPRSRLLQAPLAPWTTEDEMVGWHHRLNGHEFEELAFLKLLELAMDREAWHAAVHGVTKSLTHWVTKLRKNNEYIKYLNLWFELNILHLIWPCAQEIYLTFQNVNVITLA